MEMNLLEKEIRNELGIIIGVPTSGTTVVNSFFNAFENIFAMSEPHLEHFETGKAELEYLPGFDGDINQLSPYLRIQAQEKEDIDLGLLKETYTLRPNLREDYKIAAQFNYPLYIFVFREPAFHFDAKVDMDPILHEIGEFIGLYRNKKEQEDVYTVPVLYEEFCLNTRNHFNEMFSDLVKIEGVPELQQEEFYAGHDKSNRSKSIQDPRNSLRNISKEVAVKVNDKFREEYSSIFGDDVIYPIEREAMTYG